MRESETRIRATYQALKGNLMNKSIQVAVLLVLVAFAANATFAQTR